MTVAGNTAPDELLALVRLMAVPRLGRATLWTLLRRYTTAESALRAVAEGRTGLPASFRVHLESAHEIREGARRLERLERLGVGVLVRGRPGYPEALLRLADPPTVLFHRGRPELLSLAGVAIIGARRCTPYGVEATRLLAGGIARANVAVVSGLARGIDGAAHAAALDTGGPTIAVTGTGIDVTYPREHAALQERIAREGLVLSELRPGAGPLKHHFPERNRIIAMLSKGMIVVEAGPASGTRATVDFALDHGVDVFAVPGPIGRPQSEGTHRMIEDGAGLAVSAAAVLGALGLPSPVDRPGPVPAGPADGVAGRILEALGGWERTLDELAAAAALNIPEALPVLLDLELSGRVERRPGARFAAVTESATPVVARV